jgi:hypothetical protein
MTPIIVYTAVDGYVIARPAFEGGGVQYWNVGDVWGPKGHHFTCKRELMFQVGRLLPVLARNAHRHRNAKRSADR